MISLQTGIEVWCNGSTRDFGSLCPGSNPGISTKAISQPWAGFLNVYRPPKARFQSGLYTFINKMFEEHRLLLLSAPAAAEAGSGCEAVKS